MLSLFFVVKQSLHHSVYRRGRQDNQRFVGREEQERKFRRSHSRRCCFRWIPCSLFESYSGMGLPHTSSLFDKYLWSQVRSCRLPFPRIAP